MKRVLTIFKAYYGEDHFQVANTLGNLASGLMIMVYRPFDVDDYGEHKLVLDEPPVMWSGFQGLRAWPQ